MIPSVLPGHLFASEGLQHLAPSNTMNQQVHVSVVVQSLVVGCSSDGLLAHGSQ